MIVLAKISPNSYSDIMKLVNAGKYNSIESFVELAVQNQILIEESQHEHAVPNLANSTTTRISETVVRTSSPTINDPLYLLSEYQVKVVEPSPSADSNSRLNWGLTSRLAPAKVVLRFLANKLASNNAEWLDHRKFNEDVVDLASYLRIRLSSIERKLNLVRGESFQIGFPHKDVKSQQWFTDLYVGRLRSGNKVSGILADLQLVKIVRTSNGNASMGITEHGLKWASMRCPLIDDLLLDGKPIQNAFSKDELRFLIAHIRVLRKEEYDLLEFILRSIREGQNTPVKLADSVRHYFEKDKYSEKVTTTLRIGGIAKLVEMRLVRIEKNGLYSTYKISNDLANLEALLK